MEKNHLCLPFGARHVLNSEFVAVNTCLLFKTNFLRDGPEVVGQEGKTIS